MHQIEDDKDAALLVSWSFALAVLLAAAMMLSCMGCTCPSLNPHGALRKSIPTL